MSRCPAGCFPRGSAPPPPVPTRRACRGQAGHSRAAKPGRPTRFRSTRKGGRNRLRRRRESHARSRRFSAAFRAWRPPRTIRPPFVRAARPDPAGQHREGAPVLASGGLVQRRQPALPRIPRLRHIGQAISFRLAFAERAVDIGRERRATGGLRVAALRGAKRLKGGHSTSEKKRGRLGGASRAAMTSRVLSFHDWLSRSPSRRSPDSGRT